ncbi:hypothetical protein Bbelb_377680 [Branchiostoma belcheri]|nr:hypothetical protein Bbelb_377680 [Branchiostoma belcheri]
MSATGRVGLAIEDPYLNKLQNINLWVKMYVKSGMRPKEIDLAKSLLHGRDQERLPPSDILGVQIVLAMIIVNLSSTQTKEHVLNNPCITLAGKALTLLDFVNTPLSKPPPLTRVSIHGVFHSVPDIVVAEWVDGLATRATPIERHTVKTNSDMFKHLRSDQTGDLSPDTHSCLDVINEAFDAYVKPALHTSNRFQPLVNLGPEPNSSIPTGTPHQPLARMPFHRRGATGGTTRHSSTLRTPVRDSGGLRRNGRNRKRSRARVSGDQLTSASKKSLVAEPAEDPPLDLRTTCDNPTPDKTAVRPSPRVDAEVCAVNDDVIPTGARPRLVEPSSDTGTKLARSTHEFKSFAQVGRGASYARAGNELCDLKNRGRLVADVKNTFRVSASFGRLQKNRRRSRKFARYSTEHRAYYDPPRTSPMGAPLLYSGRDYGVSGVRAARGRRVKARAGV